MQIYSMDPLFSWTQPEQLGKADEAWSSAFKFIFSQKYRPAPEIKSTPQSKFPFPITTRSSVNMAALENQNPQPRIPMSKSETNLQHVDFALCSLFLTPAHMSIFHCQLMELRRLKDAEYQQNFLMAIEERKRNNKASTYGFIFTPENIRASAPWVTQTYSQDTWGLHHEIIDFFKYISPTLEEKSIRDRVIERITQVVKKIWPDGRVDVFGSFKTGLFLPTSDIDMVISLDHLSDIHPLRILEKAIYESGMASDIRLLDRAAVPIIKLKDIETDVRIDIGLNIGGNSNTGVHSADLILNFMKQFPMLAYLVVVLKQFLLQRELNEVWTGGLSSYSLILMCVRFLQDNVTYPQDHIEFNLGKLLIELFEFYSRQFNYRELSICVKDGGAFVRKAGMSDRSTMPVSYLAIEDPFNPDNDIGRGSYRFLHVKMSFEQAFSVLSNCSLPRHPSHLLFPDVSLLSRIICITPEVQNYRHWIKMNFINGQRRDIPPSPFIEFCSNSKTDKTDSIEEESSENPSSSIDSDEGIASPSCSKPSVSSEDQQYSKTSSQTHDHDSTLCSSNDNSSDWNNKTLRRLSRSQYNRTNVNEDPHETDHSSNNFSLTISARSHSAHARQSVENSLDNENNTYMKMKTCDSVSVGSGRAYNRRSKDTVHSHDLPGLSTGDQNSVFTGGFSSSRSSDSSSNASLPGPYYSDAEAAGRNDIRAPTKQYRSTNSSSSSRRRNVWQHLDIPHPNSASHKKYDQPRSNHHKSYYGPRRTQSPVYNSGRGFNRRSSFQPAFHRNHYAE